MKRKPIQLTQTDVEALFSAIYTWKADAKGMRDSETVAMRSSLNKLERKLRKSSFLGKRGAK